MFYASKLCAKRRVQLFMKCLILITIIGIYFIILLRESIAELEITNKRLTNTIEMNDLHHKYQRKLTTFNRTIIIKSSSTTVNNKKLQYHHHHHHHHHNEGHRKPNHHNYEKIAQKPILPPKPPEPTTLNPIYEYSEELNAAAEHDFTDRQSKLWDICTKSNLIGIHPPNAWEFFISSGHNLAWCNVFKAASSTWMYYFNILAGYNMAFLQRTNISPIELARKRFPRPSPSELDEALQTSLSFLIVREPFERLLSGYRDKLEGYRNKYYKILGEQIVKKFRKLSKSSHIQSAVGSSGVVSSAAASEVRSARAEISPVAAPIPPLNIKTKKNNSGPTFKEFTAFLIDSYKHGEQFDEHWSPIYSFCTPCSINFTLIAKVETFKRDSEYIIRQAGLETLLLNKLPQKKMKSITNQANVKTSDHINKYFSQIDMDDLENLLEIFGYDFQLFGYNSTKYFDIVQPSSSSILLKSQDRRNNKQSYLTSPKQQSMDPILPSNITTTIISAVDTPLSTTITAITAEQSLLLSSKYNTTSSSSSF